MKKHTNGSKSNSNSKSNGGTASANNGVPKRLSGGGYGALSTIDGSRTSYNGRHCYTISIDSNNSNSNSNKNDTLRRRSSSIDSLTNSNFDVLHEMQLLLQVSVPSVLTQLSLLLVFTQAASVVGRTLGSESFAGFSLGSLIGNLTCLSVMVGALSAAETLMPRAYGSADYREMGRLAVRSFFVCAVLLVPPVVPLCTCIEWIFIRLGQDPVAAHLAALWLPIYLVGTPAVLVFRILQRFLLAQGKPWPAVYASMVPSFCIHPVSMRVCIAVWGLEGSAVAVAVTQWLMVIYLLVYLYFRPVYHPESWPGEWGELNCCECGDDCNHCC
jgi:multidrug resistance protein, MATE family